MYRLKMENNEINRPVAHRWTPYTIVYKVMTRNNREETADRMLVKNPEGENPRLRRWCVGNVVKIRLGCDIVSEDLGGELMGENGHLADSRHFLPG